jgi:glycogen operon protein
LRDSSYLVLFNAHHDVVEFKLPDAGEGVEWRTELDTSYETGEPAAEVATPHGTYRLQGRSLALLREVPPGRK